MLRRYLPGFVSANANVPVPSVNCRPTFGCRVTMLKPSGWPVSALTTVPRMEGCCAARCVANTDTTHTRADARGESRTLMGLPPTDFESVASAIPPLGPFSAREIYLQIKPAAATGQRVAAAAGRNLLVRYLGGGLREFPDGQPP